MSKDRAKSYSLTPMQLLHILVAYLSTNHPKIQDVVEKWLVFQRWSDSVASCQCLRSLQPAAVAHRQSGS